MTSSNAGEARREPVEEDSGEQVSFLGDVSTGRVRIALGEREVGLVDLALQIGELVVFHLEIEPAFGGRGLATRLATYVLDDARSRGVRVRALCPFVATVLARREDVEELRAP